MRKLLSAVLLAGLLVGCGGQEKASQVPLTMLVSGSADYDDRQVITQGVVRHFEDPLHYWIEDDAFNRVEIFPQQIIAPYLGKSVRVEGHFRYSDSEGRRLTLGDVELMTGQAQSAKTPSVGGAE